MFWVDSVSSSHAATKNTDRTRVNKKNTHIKHLLDKDSCEVIHGAYGYYDLVTSEGYDVEILSPTTLRRKKSCVI